MLIAILSLTVLSRTLDIDSADFHEDFSTDEYESVHDEAWNSSPYMVHEYHQTGSWDGTGFARIYPPYATERTIPTNGGRNAISLGFSPHPDTVYYGAVVRIGQSYGDTAINTGYRSQNKFIIIDVEGSGNNRGMCILEADHQPMWMWEEGHDYSPTADPWDYQQVCHNFTGYDCIQAHTSSADNEPGTLEGAGYWSENLDMRCSVEHFSFGWCEDNTCGYDFDTFSISEHEDEWIYLEIRADRPNSVASTSIYTRDGNLSGVLGSMTADYQTPFVSVGIGYFFNGIHARDPDNYIDIADIFISNRSIGPPDGFTQGGCIHDAEEEPCDGVIDNSEIRSYSGDWKSGLAQIGPMLDALRIWKG